MYIRVFTTPDAKRDELVKESEAVWRIAVREPATGNRANKRVCEMVAQVLGVPKTHARILTGHHSRSKLISVDT